MSRRVRGLHRAPTRTDRLLPHAKPVALALNVATFIAVLVVAPSGAARVGDLELQPSPSPGQAATVLGSPAQQAKSMGQPSGNAEVVAELARTHDCWTGDRVDPPTPTRAVVTLPGRDPQLVPAEVGFAVWLGPDGVPGTGDEKSGELHLFCR